MTQITENVLLAVSEFNKMKVVQYEAIPIVKDMECPNCHNSDIGGFPPHERAKPIGWCETSAGFMGVFECPECFEKFRCHISTGSRWHIEGFYEDFALKYYLYKKAKL